MTTKQHGYLDRAAATHNAALHAAPTRAFVISEVAFVASSMLVVDVVADLLLVETNGGNCITTRPEVFPIEVALASALSVVRWQSRFSL